jgi:hypothetical protein
VAGCFVIATIRLFIPSAGGARGFANIKISHGVGYNMRKFGMHPINHHDQLTGNKNLITNNPFNKLKHCGPDTISYPIKMNENSKYFYEIC